MFYEGKLFESCVYGVVAFHFMEEGKTQVELKKIAAKRMQKYVEHIKDCKEINTWLEYKVGLIDEHTIFADVQGSETIEEDGSVYKEFEKDGYAFSPAIILLGNCEDVRNAPLDDCGISES